MRLRLAPTAERTANSWLRPWRGRAAGWTHCRSRSTKHGDGAEQQVGNAAQALDEVVVEAAQPEVEGTVESASAFLWRTAGLAGQALLGCRLVRGLEADADVKGGHSVLVISWQGTHRLTHVKRLAATPTMV